MRKRAPGRESSSRDPSPPTPPTTNNPDDSGGGADFGSLMEYHASVLSKKFGKYHLTLGFNELFIVIAHLKLAMHHTGELGDFSKIVATLVNGILDNLEESSPGIGDLLHSLKNTGNEEVTRG